MHARHSHLKPAAGQAIIPQDRGFGVTVRLEVPLQVLVRDNNVEQAIRVLKKKMQREGLFREMKQRKAYEKPSQRKTREKAEAVRRARKVHRVTPDRSALWQAARGDSG